MTDIYNIKDLDEKYTTEIKHIYHISDIHIPLYKRHTEYLEVFDKLLSYFRAEKAGYSINIADNRNIECICIITGDILHSKSDLSPECVAMTYKLFKDISELMPLIIMPGNHDTNMNNLNRMDSLTPIICDLPAFNPVHYLNATGIYKLGNLIIAHASIFDYIIPSHDKIVVPVITENITKIVLFHGRINGVLLYNGTGVQGEENGLDKKVITMTDFAGYDMGLFGDIHRHQWLDNAKSRAYAGSLIQQHHGEDLAGHGLIKWNVATRTGVHIPIENNYGYETFHIVDNQNEYLVPTGPGIFKASRILPKNLKVRILYSGTTTQVQISAFINQLKMLHNVLEYSSQAESTRMLASGHGGPDANILGQKPQALDVFTRAEEMNIHNVDYQNEFIEDYLKEHEQHLSQEDIELIKTLNKDANKLLFETGDLSPTTGTIKYKLVRLEFDNLFSYGPKNVIDFSQFKGIVGIVAPNHTGKSAILDIILWSLFDKFPRKGSTKDIINNRSNTFRVHLEVDIGVWRYIIGKNGKKSTGATFTIKSITTFMRKHLLTGKLENLQKETETKTKDCIADMFGAYEDMINTNFSIQTNSTGFIDAENTARRKELERILRFDFLTELAKKAGTSYSEKKAVFEHLQKTMPPELIERTIKTITQCDEKITKLNTSRTEHIAKIAELQAQVNELNKQTYPDIDKQIDALLLENDISTLTLDGTGTLDSELSKHADTLTNKLECLTGKSNTIYDIIKAKCNELNITCPNKPLTKTVVADIKTGLDSKRAKHQSQRAKYQTEINTLTTEINTIMRNKKAFKVQQHSNKNVNWFTTTLLENRAKITDMNAKLSALIDDINKINTLTQKIAGHRTRIDEKRLENEQLMMADVVPKSMVDLLMDGTAIRDVNGLISGKLQEVAQDATGNISPTSSYFTELVALYKKVGWLEGIEAMITKSVNTQTKLGKNNIRIAECKDRILKYEQDITKLQQAYKQKTILESSIKDITNVIITLEYDMTVAEANYNLDKELDALQIKKQGLDKLYMSMTIPDVCDKINTLLVQYCDIEVDIKNARTTLKNMKTIATELEELTVKAENNTKLQAEMVTVMHKIDEITGLVSKVTGELEVTKDMMAGQRAYLDKMKAECNTKIETEKLMNIYKSYSNAVKDIPYRLINKIKGVLERKVNDLLTVVTDFTVKFDIDGDKINIYLDRPVYNGRLILINNSSGFERFISSLAIRIALMEISQLPSPNFMAIDEGWSCFDNENINNVDVILDHLSQKFDYILTISHLQVIRQHCDIQVNLKRDESGLSHVNFV